MVGFRMTVGKGEPATAVMVSAGRVVPERRFHAKSESGVVQPVDILIHQHPEHGRAGIADRGELSVGNPGRVPVVSLLVVEADPIDRQVRSPGVL